MIKLIQKWYEWRLAKALYDREQLTDDDKIKDIDEKIWKLKGKVAWCVARRVL